MIVGGSDSPSCLRKLNCKLGFRNILGKFIISMPLLTKLIFNLFLENIFFFFSIVSHIVFERFKRYLSCIFHAYGPAGF